MPIKMRVTTEREFGSLMEYTAYIGTIMRQLSIAANVIMDDNARREELEGIKDRFDKLWIEGKLEITEDPLIGKAKTTYEIIERKWE